MIDRTIAVLTAYRLVLIKATAVSLVLFLVALSAFLLPHGIYNRYFLLTVGTPILAAGALVCLRFPSLGLIAIVVSDFLVSFSIGTGSQTSLGAPLLLLMALSGLWILDDLANRRPLAFFHSPPVVPLFWFVLVAVLAFLNGLLPWFPLASHATFRAQAGGLAMFILAALAFLLVAFQTRSVGWLKALVWIFLGLGSIFVFGRLIPRLGYITGRYIVYGIEGSLIWIWLVSLSLSQAIYNNKLHTVWRAALAFLALATIYAGLSKIAWTSGWLPSGISAVIILILGMSPLIGMLTVIGGSFAAFMVQRTANFVMSGDNEYSLVTRFEAWAILGKIIKASPLLGLGPGNYYWYTPLFPILGYAVQFNSHNNYVDLVAQCGIIGLACFLWFAWTIGRLGWRLKSSFPSGFEKAYVIGALGGLAGALASGMLGDWIIPFVYNVGYTGFRASLLGWLFLGGLVALDRMKSQP